MTDISALLRGVPAGEARVLSLIAPPRSSSFSHNNRFQKKSGPGTVTTGWIPNKLDSGFQLLDSRFHELDSGFQSRGFRIPRDKIARIPDYLTWGDTRNSFFDNETIFVFITSRSRANSTTLISQNTLTCVYKFLTLQKFKS